uniref:Cyclin-D-binding Myb-like transcription factor 1 n=1 Tax=Cyprinodon variegatus TaxID=28743 RepID=A0A3Q2GCP4_CYPVA
FHPEEEPAALESVKPVTLTQDSDGSIILHCPSNGGSTETPFFFISPLVSESDDSFEVTMTATAEGDLPEEGVTEIEVDVMFLSFSALSSGHRWKQGMWSKEEINILIDNIDQYMRRRGIQDPAEIIFEMSKEERKDFYRSVALGLNRPLFAVYRRVLRMYDDRNHVGKYTAEEIEKLKALREKHGNDWATIGAALGRSASSVKDRCRLMKDTCNTGKWSEEEERRLAEVVYEMAGVSPGSAVTAGVSWATVADRVRTRSEKQCRSKWLNYLNWKHSGGAEWTKEDDLNLLRRISMVKAEDENDIKWEDLAWGWSSVRSPQWLRSKWWSIKRQVANHKDIPFSSNSSCSPAPGSLAALQIPVQIPLQITHLSASDSAAAADGDAIALNSGALQTFEILPSFHLQPTGTPGTYYLQTTSNQSLPLSLSNNSTVTLTTSSSPSPQEHIILHSLSVSLLSLRRFSVLLFVCFHVCIPPSQTDGLCSGDGVIIQTVSSDPASSEPPPLMIPSGLSPDPILENQEGSD